MPIEEDVYKRQVHTSMDGDTLFTMASGEVKTTIDTVGYMAEEAVRPVSYTHLDVYKRQGVGCMCTADVS